MTREEAIEILSRPKLMKGVPAEVLMAHVMAVEALEQEPCEDCISRQAAIDACLNGWNKDYKEIVEEIRTLPPVTPKQKTGHWVYQYTNGFGRKIYNCSNCGGGADAIGYDFCPFCGFKMEGRDVLLL